MADTPIASATPQPQTTPRIVEDGVQFVDAWNMPAAGWQAWLSRPPGDDTYGRVDMIAVSVTFFEPVDVHPDATFHIGLGYYGRNLVSVSTMDNTAYFATTIGNNWYDTDSVQIGDQTETLGHNQADFFQHAETGVNADLTHPALGRFSNHKVDGTVSRPDVVRTEIIGPACDNSYLRDEKVTVKVTFDQKVNVRGTPQVVLKLRGDNGQRRTRASYARGAGTNTIYLEYPVTAKDREPVGIRLDQNAMLIQRSEGNLPLNGARVTGQRGGLHADLRTRGLERSQTAPVDGSRRLKLHCPIELPAAPVQANWKWNSPQPATTSYRSKFTITNDPGLGTDLTSTTFIAGRMLIANERFIIGLHNLSTNPRDNANPIKSATCASWDSEAGDHGTPAPGGWKAIPANVPGSPTALVIPYSWTAATYTLSVERTTTGTIGSVFKCYVTAHNTDNQSGETTTTRLLIGSFFFANQSGKPAPTINPNFPRFGAAIGVSGPDTIRPIDIPVMSVAVERPKLGGMRRPRYADISCVIRRGQADNGLATFDSNSQTITLTAGGETSHEGITPEGTRFTFNAKR